MILCYECVFFFFFKQKTAYEMRISDWSSDVCSSDLARFFVYRTVRLFEEEGILDRHDFGDGRSRYEAAPAAHHDHLIDVETGNVIEFVDPELEALQKVIAERLGLRLVAHRMELYGERKSVVEGQRGAVSVTIGGRRIL